MAKDGTVAEPQPSDKGAENPETEAAELVEPVDADNAFASPTPQAEPVSSELDEDGNPIEPEPEPELDEDGNPVKAELEPELDEDGNPIKAEEEEELSEEHKSEFTDKGFKIFKGRIGKMNKRIEKLKDELATEKTASEQLKKEADPNVRSVMESGIDSRFIEAADAETLTEAAKVERRTNWLEQISSSPDGYEDAEGNVFTQVQVLAELTKATRNKETQKLLTKAESIREAASTRQAAVIEAGIKALAKEEAVKAALKKQPKKKTADPAPGAKRSASSELNPPAAPANLSNALKKKGRTAETIAENF